MSQALLEVRSDMHKTQMAISGVVEMPINLEAEQFVTLMRLAERLYEEASRGLYHASMTPERLARVGAIAGTSGEREAR